jgi:hypothetical protein
VIFPRASGSGHSASPVTGTGYRAASEPHIGGGGAISSMADKQKKLEVVPPAEEPEEMPPSDDLAFPLYGYGGAVSSPLAALLGAVFLTPLKRRHPDDFLTHQFSRGAEGSQHFLTLAQSA